MQEDKFREKTVRVRQVHQLHPYVWNSLDVFQNLSLHLAVTLYSPGKNLFGKRSIQFYSTDIGLDFGINNKLCKSFVRLAANHSRAELYNNENKA